MPIDLALVLSVVALVPFIIYFIQRYAYAPKFFFRVSGEQSGEPIIVPKEGEVMFAVSTKSRHRTFISEVWVYYNPDEVDLSKTEGAEKRVTTEQDYPVALFFSGTRILINMILQGFGWKHTAVSKNFSLKLIAYGQIDETEIPFHDMFPARKLRSERLVRFEVRDEYQNDLKKNGLPLKPSESLQIEGLQAQSGMWAASDKPAAQLKVIELFKDK